MEARKYDYSQKIIKEYPGIVDVLREDIIHQTGNLTLFQN